MCGTPAQPGKCTMVPWQVDSLDTNYIIFKNDDIFKKYFFSKEK